MQAQQVEGSQCQMLERSRDPLYCACWKQMLHEVLGCQSPASRLQSPPRVF